MLVKVHVIHSVLKKKTLTICYDRSEFSTLNLIDYYGNFTVVHCCFILWLLFLLLLPFLWTHYKKSTHSKLRVAFNNVYRRLLKLSPRSSASTMYGVNHNCIINKKKLNKVK